MLNMTISETSVSFLSNTIQINGFINARETCNFKIDSYDKDDFSSGSEVIVSDDNGINVFGGFIKKRSGKFIPQGDGIGYIRFTINCVDYNSICDKINVNEVYEDIDIYDLIVDLYNGYFVDEGITLGNVPSGQTIIQAKFPEKKMSDVLNYFQNNLGLNWKINHDKELNFFYREDNIGDPLTDNDIMNFEFIESMEDFRTVQILRAGQDTTDIQENQSPTPKPDGVSRIFKFRYPLAKEPVIRENGITISNTSIGIKDVETDMYYYWSKGDSNIYHDESRPTLTDSDAIDADIYGLFDIKVEAENAAKIEEMQTIEGGTGKYYDVEDVATIEDSGAAIDYANGLLQKYSNIPTRIIIYTQSYRELGKLIQITHNGVGYDEESFLLEAITIEEKENYIFYKLQFASGESFGSWVEFFRKLRIDKSDFIISGDEVLIDLNSYSEACRLWSRYLYGSYQLLYPYPGLMPSISLEPGYYYVISSEVTAS